MTVLLNQNFAPLGQVTAFGGDRVIQLLRAIERHHQRFKRPPIGPIGSHLVSNGANANFLHVYMFIMYKWLFIFMCVLTHYCDTPKPGGFVDNPSTHGIPVGVAYLDTTISIPFTEIHSCIYILENIQIYQNSS